MGIATTATPTLITTGYPCAWKTTLSGQSYGNGEYIVTSSSTYWHSPPGVLLAPWFLFARDPNIHYNLGASWEGSYDHGVFIAAKNSPRYTLDGSYYGEWVTVKLPERIVLTGWSFTPRPNIAQRLPSVFKVYGSNDGSTWTVLHDQSTVAATTTFTVSTQNSYSYIGLVVSRLGIDPISGELNFLQWDIYGVPGGVSSVSIMIQDSSFHA